MAETNEFQISYDHIKNLLKKYWGEYSSWSEEQKEYDKSISHWYTKAYKLDKEANKIEEGFFETIDDEAPDKIISVAWAIKCQVCEMVFADVVIPQVIGMKPEERAEELNKLLTNTDYMYAFYGVAKYIPTSTKIKLSEADLLSIQEEIRNSEKMAFEKAAEVVKAIKGEYVLEDDVSEAIDELYVPTKSRIDLISNHTLTPYMERKMKSKIKRLAELKGSTKEEDVEEAERIRRLIHAEFGNFVYLDDAINELVNVSILEPKYEAVNKEREEFGNQNKDSRFLINTNTGEVIDNRTNNKEEQIVNYVYATGKKEVEQTTEEKEIMDLYLKNFLERELPVAGTLSGDKKLEYIKKKYSEKGNRWFESYKQDVIDKYVSSWKATTANQQKRFIDQGLKERNAGEDRVYPVSFEEVIFTHSKFRKSESVLTPIGGDNPVSSKKTKAVWAFADAWARAFGKTVGEDGKEISKTSVAFDSSKEPLFNAVVSGINHSFEETGGLDLFAVMEVLPKEMKTEPILKSIQELCERNYDQVVAFHDVQVSPDKRIERADSKIV